MQLEHMGPGIQSNWDTVVQVHIWPRTPWDWDTMGLGHSGPVVVHNGTSTQWVDPLPSYHFAVCHTNMSENRDAAQEILTF